MVVSSKTDLRFPESGQQGHGARIIQNMTNAQLQQEAGFSANIITRLKRNGYISLESVESICRVLNCGVDDILEFVPEDNGGKENG